MNIGTIMGVYMEILSGIVEGLYKDNSRIHGDFTWMIIGIHSPSLP